MEIITTGSKIENKTRPIKTLSRGFDDDQVSTQINLICMVKRWIKSYNYLDGETLTPVS